MLVMTEREKRSVDYYQEAYMQNWKRTLMNAGVSLTVVGAGALAAEGAVSAHDAVDHEVVAPDVVRGVVTAVGTGSFTLTNHGGTEMIDTTATTTLAESGTPVAPTTVAVGQTVVVSLDPTVTTPTAVRVTVLLNRLHGKVINVTGSSITLSGPRGTTRQAIVSPTTMVFSGKTAATNVSDGQIVTVFGTPDATTPTELNALFIDIAPNFLHPAPGPVANPNRGPGHDDHGDRGGAPVTTTPTTASVTPPTPGTEPEPEPGDPDHNGVPGIDDQGDQDGNGPAGQADNDNSGNDENGGGEGGGGFSGSGSSGGGHGSGGQGGGH
jgi:uncharacterized membrane protein YgcG